MAPLHSVCAIDGLDGQRQEQGSISIEGSWR